MADADRREKLDTWAPDFKLTWRCNNSDGEFHDCFEVAKSKILDEYDVSPFSKHEETRKVTMKRSCWMFMRVGLTHAWRIFLFISGPPNTQQPVNEVNVSLLYYLSETIYSTDEWVCTRRFWHMLVDTIYIHPFCFVVTEALPAAIMTRSLLAIQALNISKVHIS